MALKGKKKWIAIGAAALALLIVPRLARGGSSRNIGPVYTQEHPEERELVKYLSGSGMLKPANSYTVTTLIEGDVLSADFEEGDMVEKDDVLYTIDSSDISNSLERAGLTLSQAQRNYSNAADLRNVKAPGAGTVYSIAVSAGDSVSAGQVLAVVRDSSVMSVKLPFQADDAAGFYVGQSADVSLPTSFTVLTGRIAEISGSDNIGSGGGVFRNVTIELDNPRALTPGQPASATVAGKSCAQSGLLECRYQANVYAPASGEVTAIKAPEGSAVSKDQVILTLGGKALDDQIKAASDNLRSAQLTMGSARDQLDNYTVKSPIKGTIVDKQYKTGDTVSAGKILCTIYDLSYLEMTLSVDELDIRFVEVGQPVSVTADAAPDAVYSGIVTKVSVAGTSSGNTTIYPVTVRIEETEGLLPGMNADAEITVATVESALSIPNAAVSRGSVVLVTKDSPSAANALTTEAPEGYVFVPVVTGISSDTHVQIISGLTAEDTIGYIPESTASDDLFTIMMNGGRRS